MYNNKFNVAGYLADAERAYSNANGHAYMDFSTQSDVFLGADGSGAPCANGPIIGKKPNPYQLNISNTTGGNLTCILFGHNYYLLTANFGSATGITVTPSTTAVNYLTLLTQSASQPFETSLIRVRSSNTSQVTQQIGLTSVDANGQQLTIPIIVENYFSANQYQSTIVDIEYNMRLDGNTWLSFTVLANTSLTMTFFPASKANVAHVLSGAPALQQYAAPAVAVTASPVYVKPQLASAPKFLGA